LRETLPAIEACTPEAPVSDPSYQELAFHVGRRMCVCYALVHSPRTHFLAHPGFQFGEALLKDAPRSGFCPILDQPLEVEI
jgi:hypothetical protein